MTGPTLAFVTQQVAPSDNALRTATVMRVNATDGTVTINLGGTQLDARFLNAENPPLVGDTVAVIRQDATLLVLGSMSSGRPRRFGIVGAGMAQTTITTGAGEIAIPTASWSQEPSFLARPSRTYRITWQGRMYVSGGTIAQVIGAVRVRTGTGSIVGTILGTSLPDAFTNFSAVTAGAWCLTRFTGPAETTITLSLTLSKAAGLGTNINLIGDATQAISVTIEDVTDTLDASTSILDTLCTTFTS